MECLGIVSQYLLLDPAGTHPPYAPCFKCSRPQSSSLTWLVTCVLYGFLCFNTTGTEQFQRPMLPRNSNEFAGAAALVGQLPDLGASESQYDAASVTIY